MALGQVTVSYPPVIPRTFPEVLQDFILKFVALKSSIVVTIVLADVLMPMNTHGRQLDSYCNTRLCRPAT